MSRNRRRNPSGISRYSHPRLAKRLEQLRRADRLDMAWFRLETVAKAVGELPPGLTLMPAREGNVGPQNWILAPTRTQFSSPLLVHKGRRLSLAAAGRLLGISRTAAMTAHRRGTLERRLRNL